LAKAYGSRYVQELENLHGDNKGSFALLFHGTSAQVLLEWNHKINRKATKGLRRATISLKYSVKTPPSHVKKWTTRAGIVPGMKLKDLEAITGEFMIEVSRLNRKKITTVYKHKSDTTTYTIFFDPELKFTRTILKLHNPYSSKLPEVQDENPEIYAVELSKEFRLPPRQTTVPSQENGDVKDSMQVEPVIPADSLAK